MRFIETLLNWILDWCLIPKFISSYFILISILRTKNDFHCKIGLLLNAKTLKQKHQAVLLYQTLAKEQPQEGVIIAVGEGKKEDGKRMPLDVKKGDNNTLLATAF